MVLEVAILDIKPGQSKRFLEAFDKAQHIIASAAGCQRHEHHASEGMYELSGLSGILEKSASRNSDEMLRDIVHDVERFAGGCEAHDDQTLLLVSVV